MQTVLSKDKTPIAYEVVGEGPLLIIVSGALNTHNFGVPSEMTPYLQESFTVLTYDRRGRGESSNTPPYAIEKEIEDLEGLIDANGGKAYLYGHSAGAALALFASEKFPEKIDKVVVYEPPMPDNWLMRLATNFMIKQMSKQVSRGENLKVVNTFMRFVGMDDQLIADTLAGEHGQTVIDMAETITYEAKIQDASKDFIQEKAQKISQPTLLISGTKSFKSAPKIMADYASVIPNAQTCVLDGQTHTVEPQVIAPILKEFLLRS